MRCLNACEIRSDPLTYGLVIVKVSLSISSNVSLSRSFASGAANHVVGKALTQSSNQLRSTVWAVVYISSGRVSAIRTVQLLLITCGPSAGTMRVVCLHTCKAKMTTKLCADSLHHWSTRPRASGFLH